MANTMSRRSVLMAPLALAGAGALGKGSSAAEPTSGPAAFRYCLNTSTIRGQGLSLVEEIEVAARAGYSGIEPWMREIEQSVQGGESLRDLAKRIEDAGLAVESAIGFAPWIVDDPGRRAEGLEALKRDMDMLRQIGGTRIAAPPAGATDQEGLDLFEVAERYRAILEIGRQFDVVPQLELWGFSRSLSRLGEIAFVASEAGHPDACLLPDVYHIYKGGSEFEGLRILSGRSMHVFHMNDYPDQPPRSEIRDADRVYPGRGVAPVTAILRMLQENGFQGSLSLELFNPDYWQQDALQVARTGLRHMQQAAEALGERDTG